MVYAVFNVTADALDVFLASALLGSAALFILIHFNSLLQGDDYIIYPKNFFILIF